MRARALLMTALVVLGACQSDRVQEADERQEATEPHLLLAQQRLLKSLDPATGEVTTLFRLPSADVSLSPDGRRFAAVRETAPEGSEEGYVAPELLIGGVEPPVEAEVLGPGRAVMWSPDGERVALISEDPMGESISIYTPATDAHRGTAAAGERWAFVGWHGPEVVAIGSDSGVVAIDSAEGLVRPLQPAPADLWGVSPEERGVLLSVAGGRATIHKGAEREPLELDGTLGDGSWSWDGQSVALVVLEGTRSRLVVVDVETGEVAEVAEGDSAQGNVVWALDGETFAFVRVHPEQRGRLQVVVCRGVNDCEPGFTWVRGVRLLGFTS